MENIAEALKIAAGILLALLLTSLLVYMYTNIRETEQQRLKNQERMAITEFNNRFNVFEKSSMYGTDIISVMGLAYNTNLKVNSQALLHADGRYNPDVEGSVNIILQLNTSIKQIKETKKWGIIDGKEVILDEKKEPLEDILKEGEYSLKDVNNLKTLKTIVVDANKQINHEIGHRHLETVNYNSKKYTTTVWTETIESATGFNDFKTRLFKNEPEFTEYDAMGRIKVMKFSEIKDVQ